MNVAFPAVIIALLILPGIVFRYAYSRGSWGWTSPVSFRSASDELAYGAIFAVVLHYAALWSASLIGYSADFRSLLGFLTGNFGPNGVDYQTAFESVERYAPQMGIYFLGLTGAAAVAGRLSHWAVRKWRLDHKTQILRFKNEWYYLLSGEVLQFAESEQSRTVDGVFLSAVVDHAKESFLYRGIVEDWSFDSDGNLDNVRLTLAHRRNLGADTKGKATVKTGEFVPADDRYYEIRGDVFVLRYSEMRTINLDYFELAEENTTTTALHEPPLATRS